MRVLIAVLAALASLTLLGDGAAAQPDRALRVPITPPWALECWVWEDDHNTAEYTLELLKGYEDHDIPARTVLIDSPWSTRYNDFIVDEQRYPKPAEFFGGLQQRGYRVVLWMTPMVNSQSDDTRIPESADWYAEASAKGHLAGAPGEVRFEGKALAEGVEWRFDAAARRLWIRSRPAAVGAYEILPPRG